MYVCIEYYFLPNIVLILIKYVKYALKIEIYQNMLLSIGKNS